MSEQPTPNQQATLDALGNKAKDVRTLAYEMRLTSSAVNGRLYGLWAKRLVDRGWDGSRLVWWKVTADE